MKYIQHLSVSDVFQVFFKDPCIRECNFSCSLLDSSIVCRNCCCLSYYSSQMRLDSRLLTSATFAKMLSLGLFVRFSTGGKLIKCSPMLKRNSHKGQPFNVYHQRQGEKPVKLEEASDALAVVCNVNRIL